MKSVIAENLVKTYDKGRVRALDDLSLDVEEGTVLSVLGPNGAGKTTVFNCITGFYKATSGALTLHTRQEATSINKVLGQPFQLDDIFKCGIRED